MGVRAGKNWRGPHSRLIPRLPFLPAEFHGARGRAPSKRHDLPGSCHPTAGGTSLRHVRGGVACLQRPGRRCRPRQRDIDIVELHRTYPLSAIVWAACGKDPGFNPLSLLTMMRRFARIDPLRLGEIQARNLNPRALKEAWTQMAIDAAEEITRLADTRPDTPIGVAFVDSAGRPGWLGDNPSLCVRYPSFRGCVPRLNGLDEPEIP